MGPPAPTQVVTGDLDGDGRPDIVTVGGAGVTIQLNNADGTFQPVTYLENAQHNAIDATNALLADVNHDGKLDLVLSGVGGNAVGVALGNGDGTFGPLVTTTTST